MKARGRVHVCFTVLVGVAMLLRTLLLVAAFLPVLACASPSEPYGDRATDWVDDEPINSTLNEQLLSSLRLPLRVRLASPKEVEELMWVIRFMSIKRGQCPCLSVWEGLRMVFDMVSPEDVYGMQRLDALQRLLSSVEMQEDTDGAEGLGQIELELPQGGEVLRVYVGDIFLQHRPGEQPLVQVDLLAHFLRQLREKGRRQRKSYIRKVEENHEQLRLLQQMNLKRGRQERLEAAHKRAKQLEMMKHRSDWQQNSTEYATHERPLISLVDTKATENSTFAHSKGRCQSIRHAIHTLQNQRVVSTERRMRYLRKEEEKMCGTVRHSLTDLTLHSESEMCNSYCSSYCEGIETLENWTVYSGSAVSVVQLHALYHNVLLQNNNYNDTAANYFSLLREIVLDDVDRGVFSTCVELCSPSVELLAEMKFFAGVLEILDDTPGTNAEVKEISPVWWGRIRHAYLRIWDASHAGSRRAIAALATMKEHGMMTPRRHSVAAVLLFKLLSERHSYFWRQAMNRGPQSSGMATPSAQKLLRFERFFAVESSWSLVNEPYLTRGRIKAFTSEIDDEEEDMENNGDPGEPPPSVFRNLFLGQLYIAGIKGVPRDLKRAKCLFLLLLRKLRYTCDVTHPEELDVSHFMEDGRGGACQEQLKALHLLRESGISMGPCGLHNELHESKPHPSLRRITRSKKIHDVVHKVLVLLSYVHLLNGLQYDMAAKYAFLAVEVSAAAFYSAVTDLPPDADNNFVVGNISRTGKLELLKNKDWPATELYTHALRRRAPQDSLFDFTRSGFLSSESLVLLAMSAFRGGVAAQQDIRFTIEHFFGARSCIEKNGGASCRTQWTFFLLREAARLWEDEANVPGILDRSYPSPRLVDAFLLMASLLRAGNITVDDIREGDLFTSPQYCSSGSPPFQPLESDTSDSYRKRLLLAARQVFPFAFPGRQVMVHAKNWYHFTTRDVPLRELRVLRAAVQCFLEEHDTNPLLVSSDIHDYMDTARWPWSQRVLGILWDALLYPFTQTQAEAVEDELAKALLPNKTVDSEPANIADGLAASVLSSRHVREATIALQLLATALISGEPDGFTLILLEDMERGNDHLHSFAHFISEHVWGKSFTEVWMEEHKAAQWHHAKPKTRGRGPVFAISSRIPFRYAVPDSRMELFAQIALKRVNIRQQCTTSGGRVSVYGNCTLSSKTHQELIHMMALCSGVLIGAAIRKGPPFVPQRPYEGMLFPVGSSLCLRRLMQYTSSTGNSPFIGLSAKAAELLLLDLLVELSEAQAHYYGLHLNDLDSSSMNSLGTVDGNDEATSKKLRKHLVEPWKQFSKDAAEEITLPGIGEGAYYNRRLHRITGTYYAARMRRVYARVKLWLSQFVRVV
ncbi:hypothetical protein TraAM80_02464 [Trypanosoma rangeli]|uniref:Uncharacterized protein n=1 Tax=Trypanosoma rangeli TaxID=5698 RepID=A0A422NTY9_TRYRA|nr:uncharacterized protein TraAM80_02464 [Trypanosoma rangeli]RNF08918.1 hypothetical protein TraAM80_02464 [Trypanosoma rangeli]|eukprot:RNF08918.1 hypothetical protein TraAM80_02464 [Trypanosoma rangeli]